MKYAFIADNLDEFPVILMCDVLDVSRGGHYHYRATGGGTPTTQLTTLLSLVREIH